MMAQEMPWHEDQAFVLTGTSFFPLRRLQDDMERCLESGAVLFKAYRYHLGETFLQSSVDLQQVYKSGDADLRVWEEPKPTGHYVIGVDPAYGRNDWKDRHAVSVWRCFADRLIQVAEFASDNPLTYQCAWIMAHLAGAYRNCIINLEVNGPGRGVIQELNNLKRQLRSGIWQDEARARGLVDAFAQARWYLYHRPDSMGTGYAYGWNTTADNKLLIMNQMRDSYTLGLMTVNSVPLLEEMEGVIQDGGEIGAPGRGKDDRVFAATLAHKAWIEWIRPKLMAQGLTLERAVELDEQIKHAPEQTFESSVIRDFFSRKDDERAQREWEAFMRGSHLG